MELTIEDIRTLQLAVDNMADDGMTDEGIKKLLVLHAKLEVMATRLTKRALDLRPCGHKWESTLMNSITGEMSCGECTGASQ